MLNCYFWIMRYKTSILYAQRASQILVRGALKNHTEVEALLPLFWMLPYLGEISLFWASTTFFMLFIDVTDFCHQKKWMRNLCLSLSCIASLPRFHPSLPSATAAMVQDQIIQELFSVLQSEEWQAEDIEKWDVTGLTPSVHTLESNTAVATQNSIKRDAAVACLTCPVILKTWPKQPSMLR